MMKTDLNLLYTFLLIAYQLKMKGLMPLNNMKTKPVADILKMETAKEIHKIFDTKKTTKRRRSIRSGPSRNHSIQLI